MRTIVDIPDNHILALKKLSLELKVSRAEIVRQALCDYLKRIDKKKEIYKSAFGILKNAGLDGVEYQRIIRNDW